MTRAKSKAFRLALLGILALGLLCLLLVQILIRTQQDTQFQEAAARGNVAAVRAYLERGGNPNIRDGYGWSALLWAAGKGHLPVVRLLLNNGANPNQQTLLGGLNEMKLWTPSTLVSGIRREGDASYPPRAVSPLANGLSPLMAAAFRGHHSIVTLLLQRGADPNLRDSGGNTASEYARQGGNAKSVAALTFR